MSSTLCTHMPGTHRVNRTELMELDAPEATATWTPVAHRDVLQAVENIVVDGLGFQIKRAEFALSRQGHRFFGTLDLEHSIAECVVLAIGVRNATDKSMVQGVCAGERVFVCDNLAFTSELVVTRRHTGNALKAFEIKLESDLPRVGQYCIAAQKRIEQFREKEVTNPQAHDVMMLAYNAGVVPLAELGITSQSWNTPTHEDFEGRTLWSLLNCFTEAMKRCQGRNPGEAARRTMKLHRLLETYGTAL